MKLKDNYELEMLKFVYKFVKNHLPKCLDNYFYLLQIFMIVQQERPWNISG